MILVQTKQLGNGWSLIINHGKRKTFNLMYRGCKAKGLTFWSEKAVFAWIAENNVDLNEKAGA
jgi:hypothetical protein